LIFTIVGMNISLALLGSSDPFDAIMAVFAIVTLVYGAYLFLKS
jgi:hypothetical protein